MIQGANSASLCLGDVIAFSDQDDVWLPAKLERLRTAFGHLHADFVAHAAEVTDAHLVRTGNRRQLWIPPCFAHGFVVLSERAQFLYKTTDYYSPEHERCLLWNDPTVGINWPIDFMPQLAAKDAAGKFLADAECFE